MLKGKTCVQLNSLSPVVTVMSEVDRQSGPRNGGEGKAGCLRDRGEASSLSSTALPSFTCDVPEDKPAQMKDEIDSSIAK